MANIIVVGFIIVLLSTCGIGETVSYAAVAKSQKLSGSPIELVWSKTLIPEWKTKRRYYLKVNPAGDNLLVHVSVESDRDSNDIPLFVYNFFLDSQGNTIWRRSYIDLPSVFHRGLINTKGKQSYRWFDRYEHIPSKKLRYYTWLDEEGYVFWVQALRIDPAYGRGKHEECSPGIIANLEAKCEGNNCQIDRLLLSEKGLLSNGWETIFRLSDHIDTKDTVSYTTVDLGCNYLLLHSKNLDKREQSELRLIQFDSKDNRILSDSKFFFPFRSHAQISRNRDGLSMYVGALDGREQVMVLLDEGGKEKKRQSFKIPKRFYSSILMPYGDGWLIEGLLDNNQHGDRMLVRLSSEGIVIWSYQYWYKVTKFAGIGNANIYFSRQGQLMKYREKSAQGDK